MQVLWWLVPPLVATGVAMLWVGWRGRTTTADERDDTDATLARMERALARPTPSKGRVVASRPLEQTHGVALRRAPRPNGGREPQR